MRRTSEKEIQAVLLLDGPARFAHFIKRVADANVAWGLWKDGWALMADDDNATVFPLWPAPEYAKLHKHGALVDHEPRAIPVESLLNELVPKLKEQGIRPAVFPTPKGKGVIPTVEELVASIRQELGNYEA